LNFFCLINGARHAYIRFYSRIYIVTKFCSAVEVARIIGTFWRSPEYNVHIREPSTFTSQIRLGGVIMKFYTVKLPKFLGGFVKAILNTFSKN